MLFPETFPASLFNVPLAAPLRLDPQYRPLALGVRNYREALASAGGGVRAVLGLEQPSGPVARLDLEVFPEGAGRGHDNLRYLAWMLNGLLWSRGGSRITVSGPPALAAALVAGFAGGGPWGFEREIMGKAFDRPLEAVVAEPAAPPAQVPERALGGHFQGCRIGFDLGASDYKVAAVEDGEVRFSAELPWDPKAEPDPAYHEAKLDEGLRLAAAHLPRVDAIGGSSAGILVDNEVRVSSLFRAVPEDRFRDRVRPLFLRLRERWGVPVDVINDGDVTALAGGLSLGRRGLLGIALGSSEAVGFLDREGRIAGWLNELAFGAVDAHPAAGRDDWSGNPGVGAAYFSQQAVARLAGPAGFAFPEAVPQPERLKAVQARLAKGDPGARDLFAALGVYLGHSLPWYAEFYGFDHVMILGRVSSGEGGEILLAKARETLAEHHPDLADRTSLFLPDERSRRVGQAVAAASLPALR